MTIIEILRDVIVIMGEAVTCFLEKVIDGAKTRYFVGIGDHEREISGPEEHAKKVYRECRERAREGAVDGIYLFLSDEEREIRESYSHEFVKPIIRESIAKTKDGQFVRLSLVSHPYSDVCGVFSINVRPTGPIVSHSSARTVSVELREFEESEAIAFYDDFLEAISSNYSADGETAE